MWSRRKSDVPDAPGATPTPGSEDTFFAVAAQSPHDTVAEAGHPAGASTLFVNASREAIDPSGAGTSEDAGSTAVTHAPDSTGSTGSTGSTDASNAVRRFVAGARARARAQATASSTATGGSEAMRTPDSTPGLEASHPPQPEPAPKAVVPFEGADGAGPTPAASIPAASIPAAEPEPEPEREPEPGGPGRVRQDEEQPGGVRLPRRGTARALLALFLVIGLATAAGAGWQWSRTVDRQTRQTFHHQASTVAAAVTTAIKRDADLTVTTRAVIEQNPLMTNAGLARWFSALTSSRHPDALGTAYIQTVSHAELYYFLLAMAADPTSALEADGPFAVTPASARAPYCFTRLLALSSAVQSAGDAAMPPGLDWCATAAAGALTAARDSGQPSVARVLVPDESALLGLHPSGGAAPGTQVESLKSIDQALGSAIVVFTPQYNSPSTPTTVTARRAAFEGWVAGIFDTGRILTAAVGSHRDFQVVLARQTPGTAPLVVATHDTTGKAAGLTATIPAPADGLWKVTVRRPAVTGWATGRMQGLAVAGAVVLGTLLLFFVLRSLVASRRRALVLAAAQDDELNHMAMHDVLTGLPNRMLVVDRAEQMLVRSRRSQMPSAALALGLDDFREFNDLHGRQAADELLRAVADRLTTLLREADTVGRLGGDEFVVLTDGASLAAGPELVAERILDVMGEPFYLGEGHPNPYTVTACVGIALGPRIEAEDLLRDANAALTQAKAAGKARFALFGQDMPQAIESRLAFETELRTAVAANQFFLRYQPIFDIESRTTTGVEALLRWQHPTRRVIPPDHFLPLLEESGLIVPVGRWVLREACRQGSLLHGNGYRIAMSVNVSACQLESDMLVNDVSDALTASGFDPHALVIEITETTLTRDTALMVERLVALKALGVRIAIDDFGTGYSSLAYLRQFPIDILKIDRSFISSMATTRDSSMLIHTLVQFGKTLGLETIAEGIEEEGQLDPLLAEQCDTGQGFLYGRPLSPTQLDIFLRTHITQEPPLWVVTPKLRAKS